MIVNDRFDILVLICLLGSLCTLPACSPEPQPKIILSHDAYIWQQQWTASLQEALTIAAPWLNRWRVLAAQVKRGGRFSPIAIDHQALVGTGKPVIAVIRINGQLADWNATRIAADSLALVAKWREMGIPVAGLEIDHDCATWRLPNYLRFIEQLQPAAKSQSLSLSITALPAWLNAAQLPALLGKLDEAVLQVHSVSDPQLGLFDRGKAKAWVEKFAALSPVPFHVALPNYGSRVAWDEQRRVVAVESEVPLGLDNTLARELSVEPEAVATLLDEWRRQAPHGLVGIAWFRLPTRVDRRAWSLHTWQAVLEGRELLAKVTAYAKPGAYPGLQDIFLRNDGDIDTPFPDTIRIVASHQCASADAIGAYHFAAVKPAIQFHLSRPATLKARRQSAVGWVRCADQEVTIDVEH